MTKKKIVVIDDDPQILETVAQLLIQGGFEVATYRGRLNRVQFIAEQRPDLVLLDVNMPLVSGDALFDILRDHSALKSVPVLFFSSNDERDLRLLVQQTGAAGYVSKSELAGDFAGKLARRLERLSRDH